MPSPLESTRAWGAASCTYTCTCISEEMRGMRGVVASCLDVGKEQRKIVYTSMNFKRRSTVVKLSFSKRIAIRLHNTLSQRCIFYSTHLLADVWCCLFYSDRHQGVGKARLIYGIDSSIARMPFFYTENLYHSIPWPCIVYMWEWGGSGIKRRQAVTYINESWRLWVRLGINDVFSRQIGPFRFLRIGR